MKFIGLIAGLLTISTVQAGAPYFVEPESSKFVCVTKDNAITGCIIDLFIDEKKVFVNELDIPDTMFGWRAQLSCVAGIGYKVASGGSIGTYSKHGSESFRLNKMQRYDPFRVRMIIHFEDEVALEAELRWARCFADVLDTSGVPAEIVESKF